MIRQTKINVGSTNTIGGRSTLLACHFFFTSLISDQQLFVLLFDSGTILLKPFVVIEVLDGWVHSPVELKINFDVM